MEYYERPSKQYPEGRLIIVAGDELLYYGALPYRNGEDGKRDSPFRKTGMHRTLLDAFGVLQLLNVVFLFNVHITQYAIVKRILKQSGNRHFDCEEGAYDMEDLEEEGLPPGKILVRKQGAQPGKF